MAVPRCALSDLDAASFEGQRPVAVERSPAVTNEYNEGPLEGQTWPEKRKTPLYRGAIYTPESKTDLPEPTAGGGDTTCPPQAVEL